MADLARLSMNQVTLLEQCDMPRFLEVLARNEVRLASLWRDKTREHGVARTKALLSEHGIALSGYCWGGLLTSPDGAEAARRRDDMRRALDEAALLGSPCLVFVAGGVDERERSVAEARKRALEGLAQIVPYARDVGVKIALEPLHPMICATRSVLSTTKLANDWCDALRAEDIVGIAIDVYAVWWDPEVETEIARAGRRICAFHVSDWLADTQDLRLDRGMMGDGVIDIAGLRRSVEQAGYAGPIEVEIFSKRNWWQRDADEVTRVVRERFASAV
ncbi:MAG TPA: sugar phosphate isomerase/epimerase family protein [Casimicrobiaceae bacterium]|nr:sugar phosphate isomerase/epimerase family protein [Casimicrobiaceae bacterium]